MSKEKKPLTNDNFPPRSILSLLLLVLFILYGCDTSQDEIASSTAVQPTPIPTQTAVPNTPTPLPAPNQPIPTATATHTPLPSSTPTAVPTESPSPTPTPVRLAVIGDYGLAGAPAEAVATLVKSWQPDFIITTGDNNYPIGSAETIDENIGRYYADYIFPYSGAYGPGADGQNRFFPSLGNHDWDAPGVAPYLDYFELPGNERYYDFTWGPLHLFALNTDSREPDGVSAGSSQAAWLQTGLAASERPWKIVYGHLSPYSSGIQGGIDWMNWPFQDWGATVLLAAHDHVYERIIRNDFPYLINGLGGGPRYLFEETEIDPGSVIRYRDNHGAMLITADWQQITFEFYTIDGQRIDHYSP